MGWRHQLRCGACVYLHLLRGAQLICEGVRVGEIHVSITLDRQVRNAGIIAHEALEALDERGTELGNLDVQRVAELLADTGIGVRCCAICVGRVAFNH